MTAAIILNITVVVFVVFAAGAVDAFRDVTEETDAIRYTVASLIALAASVIVGLFSRLSLVALVVLLASSTGAVIALRLTSTTGNGDGDIAGLPVAFIESAIYSCIFMAIAWLYSGVKYHAPISLLGFVWPESATAFLYALGAWIVALTGTAIWGLIITNVQELQPPDNAAEAIELAGNSLAPALVLVGLIAPFAEETFFRGFLLNGIRQRLNGSGAVILSAAIFALFHFSVGLYVPTFLLGLALGFVYLKTRSIWPCIFLHALHNTFVIIATWQDIGT